MSIDLSKYSRLTNEPLPKKTHVTLEVEDVEIDEREEDRDGFGLRITHNVVEPEEYEGQKVFENFYFIEKPISRGPSKGRSVVEITWPRYEKYIGHELDETATLDPEALMNEVMSLPPFVAVLGVSKDKGDGYGASNTISRVVRD